MDMDDGIKIAVRHEQSSTNQEKEEIRDLMRWSYRDFRAFRQEREIFG